MEPTEPVKNLVRVKLAEEIPDGGSADDTLISDQTLTTIILGSSTIDDALISGWEVKLAQWSNLVDVTDGAASRKLGDLMAHAADMIAYYKNKVRGGETGVNRNRTRVGRIVRP